MAEAGYVLRDEAFATDEPQQIAGFPGIWRRGVAVPASVLAAARGESEEELAAYIKENEMPLDYVKDAEIDEAELAYHGGMYSSAELRSEPMGTLPSYRSTDPHVPGLTQEEVELRDKQRAERGQSEAMRTMVPAEALASGVEAMSVAAIREGISEMSDLQLDALSRDSRSSVKSLAAKERETRAAIAEENA
jgi:hypothetical protein